MPAFPKRTTTDFSNLASGNLIGYLMVPDPEFPRTPSFQRRPQPSKALTGSDRTKVKVMGRESILINKSLTDLRAVEQLTDSEQLNAWRHFCWMRRNAGWTVRKHWCRLWICWNGRWMKKDLLLFSLLEDLGIWRGRDGRRSLNAWTGAGN